MACILFWSSAVQVLQVAVTGERIRQIKAFFKDQKFVSLAATSIHRSGDNPEAPVSTAVDYTLIFLSRENKAWHFLWFFCLANNALKMLPYFPLKYNYTMSSAIILHDTARVKTDLEPQRYVFYGDGIINLNLSVWRCLMAINKKLVIIWNMKGLL